MANSSKTKRAIPDIRKLPKKSPYRNYYFALAAIASLSLMGWYYSNFVMNAAEVVSISKLVDTAVEGEYKEIIDSTDKVEIIFDDSDKNVKAIKPEGTSFYELLEQKGIDEETRNSLEEVTSKRSTGITVGDVISMILLVGALGLGYMMVRNMNANGGKLMNFGQSKARLLFGKKTGVKFDDVAGIDDVKEELVEVVDFLKNPKKYHKLGARIPRGILLVGSPGTGKTLLAKAVAGEAGVPFFHTSGAEFEEMLVGAGASRVRDLFGKAKKTAPCIIFIDEIDAVAKKRGTVLHSGNGEQTLNQILVEMDGLEERENVIVLGATNRSDVLDPAILRPGRFDRTVVVHTPDSKGREEILNIYTKNKVMEEGVDLKALAKKTVGFTGADLENVLNEAAIMAAAAGAKAISDAHVKEAYLKVRMGRKKSDNRHEDDFKRVAYHEAGHAIAAYFTELSDPVEKVSILSRGMSGGVTVYAPKEDKYLTTRGKMKANLANAVGGKLAEEIFLGDMSTGASGDIRQATQTAKAMVQQYGMSEELGFVKYGNLEDASFLGYQYGGDKDFSEQTAREIDQAVKGLIDEAMAHTRKILEENKPKVEKLVAVLLEKEEVDGPEFEALMEG